MGEHMKLRRMHNSVKLSYRKRGKERERKKGEIRESCVGILIRYRKLVKNRAILSQAAKVISHTLS